MKRTLKRIVLCAFAALSLASCATFKQAPQHDVHIPSTLDTVVWGHIPTGRAPVARVRPGQIVRIDTISHQPISAGVNPVEFFSAAGFAPDPVVQLMLEVSQKAKRPSEAGAHVLTGPVYVEGAEPGTRSKCVSCTSTCAFPSG